MLVEGMHHNEFFLCWESGQLRRVFRLLFHQSRHIQDMPRDLGSMVTRMLGTSRKLIAGRLHANVFKRRKIIQVVLWSVGRSPCMLRKLGLLSRRQYGTFLLQWLWSVRPTSSNTLAISIGDVSDVFSFATWLVARSVEPNVALRTATLLITKQKTKLDCDMLTISDHPQEQSWWPLSHTAAWDNADLASLTPPGGWPL